MSNFMRLALLLFLSSTILYGCNIEIWEGRIWDINTGETVWTHTFLDEEECRRLTIAQSNAIYRERVKTEAPNANATDDWNCTLKALYGF